MAQTVKNLPAMQEIQVRSLGREYPLEKWMGTHCSILAWRISWTEELGGLPSMGSQSDTTEWITRTKYFNRGICAVLIHTALLSSDVQFCFLWALLHSLGVNSTHCPIPSTLFYVHHFRGNISIIFFYICLNTPQANTNWWWYLYLFLQCLG